MMELAEEQVSGAAVKRLQVRGRAELDELLARALAAALVADFRRRDGGETLTGNNLAANPEPARHLTKGGAA